METTIHIPLIPAVKKPEAFHLMGERSDSMHAHHAADSMHAHHAYASKKGVALTSLKFIDKKGDRIDWDETPNTLELEDHDFINCIQEQTGGCIASPVPATFGSQHFHSTPGGQFLKKSYDHHSASTPKNQDSSSLALRLGGKVVVGAN